MTNIAPDKSPAINCNHPQTKDITATTKSFVSRLNEAGEQECYLRGKIEKAYAAGKPGKARYEIRRYLNSPSAKLVAVFDANKSRKKGLRLNKSELPKFAGKLDAWKGSAEIADIHLAPKKSKPDEPRPITSFGLEMKSLQYLVRGALQPKAQMNLKPYQYAHSGGTRAAVRQTLEHLHNGFEAVVEIDLSSCYQSFNEEALPDLTDLPVEVTKMIVSGSHLQFMFHYIGLHVGNGDPLLDSDLFRDVVAEVQRSLSY